MNVLAQHRYLPNSGRRYSINQYGEILDRHGVKLPVVEYNDRLYVELDWLRESGLYEIGQIILITYKEFDLPERHWFDLEPLYIDRDTKNVLPVNLTYRFKNAPLEVLEYPGFYYIPFHAGYAINQHGTVVNVGNGKVKSWYSTKPCRLRNSKGGYSETRVIVGGKSKGLFRHKAMCLTFLPYGEDVHSRVSNHKDGEPSNDSLSNLEWCSYSDNNRHAADNGLRPNSVKPVLLRDLRTNITLRFQSIEGCKRHLNLGSNQGSWVNYRLAHCTGKVYPDLLIFKYDDDTPWPAVDLGTLKLCRTNGTYDVVARNVFTGECYIFSGVTECSKYTGVRTSYISKHCRQQLHVPVGGYNFRYVEDSDIWPEHGRLQLEIYRKHPDHPRDGVIVKNLVDRTEMFYTSKREVCSVFEITYAQLESCIGASRIWNDLYLFEVVRLRPSRSLQREIAVEEAT